MSWTSENWYQDDDLNFGYPIPKGVKPAEPYSGSGFVIKEKMFFGFPFIASAGIAEPFDGAFLFELLSPFEKKVCIAIAKIILEDNEPNYISATKIFQVLKNDSKYKPSRGDVQKVRNAILNSDISVILPIEIVPTATINGKKAKNCIHILRHKSNQFFNDFPEYRQEYESTYHKPLTKSQMKIDLFLKREISTMKESQKFVTFQRLYKNCGIDTPSKKARVQRVYRTLLDDYKAQSLISTQSAETEKGILFVK